MSKKMDGLLKEMASLKSEITEREGRYERLKQAAMPLVEAAGDYYKVDGIEARIVRSQTWKVEAVPLLDKFGAKVHGLLTVSVAKFRKALESGLLGAPENLGNIAVLVDETPKFRLTY